MPFEQRRRIGRHEEDDVIFEIKRLAPVLGAETATRLHRAFLLGEERTRRRVLEMIDAVKAAVFADKDLRGVTLVEPLPQEFATGGNIEIGDVLYGKKRLYPLTLPADFAMTHVGIFGSSGYGKTNAIQWLAAQFANQQVPVIIFDFSKRNYRDLLEVPFLKDRVRIITVGRDVAPLRFNPLKPPEGVELSQWAKEFAEIFDHAYWLLGGGKHVILKALDFLYNKMSPNVPRIKDLQKWVHEYAPQMMSARERNWIATAERPLASLCFMDTGKVFDVDEGMNFASLFKRGQITVLELDALAASDKTFFIEITLQWIRDWLLVHGFREKLAAVVVLEEAHHVLNREKANRTGTETVIDLIFREIRELGVGMVYVDQHPSLVSYPALGNTSTHVYMNLGLDTQHSSDIKDAQAMLGLNDEDADYIRHLPVGHAFMMCRRLPFSKPFLMEFPLMNIKKGSVTDAQVARIMQEAAKDTSTKTVAALIKAAGIKTPAIMGGDISLNEVDLKIIDVIGVGIASTTSEIYKALAISGGAFKMKADRLIAAGLLGAKEGRVYKQNAVIYFLTEEGRKLFEARKAEGKAAAAPKLSTEFEDERLIIDEAVRRGWTYDDAAKRLKFVADGKVAEAAPIASKEAITKVFEAIAGTNINTTRELYLICGSEPLRQKAVQTAAFFGERVGQLKVMTAVVDRITGMDGFKRVEFH